MKIRILGKGVFGEALAEHLKRAGHEAVFDTAIGAEIVFVCTSSNMAVPELVKIQEEIAEQKIVICSKGFASPGKLISEALKEKVKKRNKIFFMYGPNLADELVKGLPAGAVLAGGVGNPAYAKSYGEAREEIKKVIESENFYVELSDDAVGVEISAALKNVMAILVGVAEGAGWGENAGALLFAKGIEEIKNIGVALGAKPETFLGLTCAGDLYLRSSRNRAFGVELGKGRKPEEIVKKANYTPAGVFAARDAQALIEEKNINAPLAKMLYGIFFENEPVENILKKVKNM